MDSDSSETCIVPTVARGMHVLLVDQDTSSLTHMRSMLEEHFYKVTAVQWAYIALTMIHDEKEKYDVVIADVTMKDTDIFTFLHQVLSTRDMPIIVLSKDRNLDTAQKVLLEGACSFLQKPVPKKELINVWQFVLWTRNFQKQNNANNKNQMAIDLDQGNIEQNTDDLFEENLLQERLNISDDADDGMVNLDERKQKESNEIQGTQTMEKGFCQGGANLEGSSTRVFGNIYNNLPNFSSENGVHVENERGHCQRQKRTEMGNSGIGVRGKKIEKRSRMRWTRDLHLKFVDAVCSLGDTTCDHPEACPRDVLERMNEPSLTLRHVSSHLQKYKERVNQLNRATDKLPLLQPMTTKSVLLTPRPSLPRPSTSVHYNIETLRNALAYSKLAQTNRPNRVNTNNASSSSGSIGAYNRPSPINPTANSNQSGDQILGFDRNPQNVREVSLEEQDWAMDSIEIYQEVEPMLETDVTDVFQSLDAPSNLQSSNQGPQLTQEANMLDAEPGSVANSLNSNISLPEGFEASLLEGQPSSVGYSFNRNNSLPEGFLDNNQEPWTEEDLRFTVDDLLELLNEDEMLPVMND